MTVQTLLRTSFCLICFVYLTGCENERPEGVLSEGQMSQILLDVYLGEGKVSGLNVKRDSSLALYEVYEKKIFEKHQVDREQYKKSLSYYYDHPEILEKIYESVLDSLNIKDQHLKELRDKEMKEKHNSKANTSVDDRDSKDVKQKEE